MQVLKKPSVDAWVHARMKLLRFLEIPNVKRPTTIAEEIAPVGHPWWNMSLRGLDR